MGFTSTYIFDIDGVLLDVSQRIALAKTFAYNDKSLFWHYFFSEELLYLDKPRKIGIDILLDRIDKGTVIIVTGRPSYLRQKTLNQLQSINIPVNRITEIYFRPKNDYRKSHIFKLETLEKIVLKGYNVLEIHDDDEEFLKNAKKIIYNVKLYLHLNNQVIELSNQYKSLW